MIYMIASVFALSIPVLVGVAGRYLFQRLLSEKAETTRTASAYATVWAIPGKLPA